MFKTAKTVIQGDVPFLFIATTPIKYALDKFVEISDKNFIEQQMKAYFQLRDDMKMSPENIQEASKQGLSSPLIAFRGDGYLLGDSGEGLRSGVILKEKKPMEAEEFFKVAEYFYQVDKEKKSYENKKNEITNNFVKELQQISKGEVIPSAAAKQELPQEKQKQQSEDKGKGQTEKTVAAKPASASKDSSTEKATAGKPAPSDKPISTAQTDTQSKTEKKETPAPSAAPSEKPKQIIVTPKPASPSTDKPDAPKISDIQKSTRSGGSESKTQETLNKAGQTLAQVEGTLKQLPQSIKTQSASQKQETQQTLSELKQKLTQLQEALKQLQNESIKKQAVSNTLPIAKGEPVKMTIPPQTPPINLLQNKISDASKLSDRNAHQQLTPTKVEFTQTYYGLFTQSADFLGSQTGTYSGTLTNGTRVNVIGDSRAGNFTGSFSGRSIAEPGYTPATHNNSPFSGSSVGKVEAVGFKEGDLRGTMTVTEPAGTQTVNVTGNITIKTDGSLSMPSYTGPVTDNASGAKVGTMTGSWSQSKTTP